MGAILGKDGLVNLASGGGGGAPELIHYVKDPRIAGVAVVAQNTVIRLNSTWMWDGTPAGGAAPGAVRIPTNATDGSLKQTNPAGGKTKWLTHSALVSTVSQQILLYDRLLDISGLDATLTTAQTVGGTITRNTGGIGNEIWIEIYTLIGVTVTSLTASYTNQDGTAGRTTPQVRFGAASPWAGEACRIIRLPFQAGDYGVRSVQSVTLVATTGTAGNFGVTLARPLAFVATPAVTQGGSRSILDYPVAIDTNACLSVAAYQSQHVFAQFFFVEA